MRRPEIGTEIVGILLSPFNGFIALPCDFKVEDVVALVPADDVVELFRFDAFVEVARCVGDTFLLA